MSQRFGGVSRSDKSAESADVLDSAGVLNCRLTDLLESVPFCRIV